MSSAAEERIRLKAETAMRAAFPEARIIHELMVLQGGCRIDLAAVEPDRLILVEVKSERDVLTRLERQREQATAVADLFRVIVADTQSIIISNLVELGLRITRKRDCRVR